MFCFVQQLEFGVFFGDVDRVPHTLNLWLIYCSISEMSFGI